MNRLAGFIVLLAALSASTDAEAHTRSESYSHWHLDRNSITGTVTIPLREAMLLYQNTDASAPSREIFQGHLHDTTRIFAADELCDRVASNILQAASGFIRVEMRFECPAAPDAIRLRAMFDTAPGHVHYAKLHRDGSLVGEALITDSVDTWNFGDIDSGNSWSFVSFVGIGVEHIASGIDHIAFLLGLLLIAGSVGRSVIAVTGFTLGHSISLAAAVLGYVHADSQLVEAFIGFTVMLIAVEYFLLRAQNPESFVIAVVLLAVATGIVAFTLGFVEIRALPAYAGFGIFAACYLLAARKLSLQEHRRATSLLFVATCCFGLVHGFGFAGFLMDTGLLGTSLFVPLLGFNLGVELGQLIIVAFALLTGVLIRHHMPRIMPQLAAAALCGIGVYWFVGRTLA